MGERYVTLCTIANVNVIRGFLPVMYMCIFLCLLCLTVCSMCRYIEVFRSTHAEIRPVASKESRWSRGTPYNRPGQWGDRGGHGGGHGGYGGYGSGGYGSGGYGTKFGSGYDRGGRGRGRGRGAPRGGGMMAPASGGYNSYSDGGGSSGYSQYSQGGYDYNTQQGYNNQYNPPVGGTNYGSAPGNDGNQMVAYPPIRSTQPGGGRGGGEDSDKALHGIRLRGLPYAAKEKEILEFFLPHVPAKVEVEYDQYGRPSGSAEVMFNSHEEAEKAMEKHNGHMGKICIRH